MSDLGEPIISVVKLPDGRMAVKNERDVSDLTREEEDEMGHVLYIWFSTRRRFRGDPDS